jgi:hypothetical protein
MSNQKCPVCNDRKSKRSCPALGRTICTVCCATKRQVEINCPPDCIYLSSARSHPPAVVQRRQERDLSFLLPLISDLTESQYRLVLLFQSVAVKHAQGAIPSVEDVDIADAASAVAATLETARKGIIYEHQAASAPAHRLTTELRGVVAELIAQNPSHQARIERESAVALRRLEQGARTALAALPGDEPPVYLKLLTRMMSGGPAGSDQSSGEETGPAASRGGLIIQP